MNTTVEIHQNDTNETGTYRVWYKENGQKKCRVLNECYTNSLLDMRQKEKFFMGQSKFKIGEYDFQNIVLEGRKRNGLPD